MIVMRSPLPVSERPELRVPLTLSGGVIGSIPQPVHAGIPFPRGQLREPVSLVLKDGTDALPTQTEVLARWPDLSVKWLLVDALLNEWVVPKGTLTLAAARAKSLGLLDCRRTSAGVIVDTGKAVFHLDKHSPALLKQVTFAGRNLLADDGLTLPLVDARMQFNSPRIENIEIETSGPIRATVRVDGHFAGRAPCRFCARLSFFADTGLVRIRMTIHNPRRARHRGGLWDLGDSGSILFREWSLRMRLADAVTTNVQWRCEPGQRTDSTRGSLEIHQASSGGVNWQSRNHVDRDGQIACAFAGYRVWHDNHEDSGLRANPVAALRSPSGSISAAIEDFWQQFPKSIRVENGQLALSLFPAQLSSLHELQGGEQKTHTIWLHFGPPNDKCLDALGWAHQPARLQVAPEWYAASQAFPYFTADIPSRDHPFERLLADALDGDDSLSARRETVDDYGWRHYGDLYADHEAAYYNGPRPVVSHYNNQYDVILGTLLHYIRTGDQRWWELAEPLARHVIDIDIYHTTQDRPAYNGGMFWHTDHYKDAATSTHRAYSRANRVAGQDYGGGPCNEHNYTTGLLHYYYMTGDALARDAVLSLANWVIAMDDGRRTISGLFDDGPTGAASCTTERTYHGPGRGCGNSINALLDGWLLTNDSKFLRKVEELLRRSIHPRDDIASLDLLNAEARWSYTVFLSVVARYLDLKAEAGQLDATYAYAQASLLHYAQWMLTHEVAYFDRPEQLEYPTETWAAQEVRKANVMRLAAAHAVEPLRSQLLKRGMELAARAWSDLARFERPGTTRALAILFVEGWKDAQLERGIEPKPRLPMVEAEFGAPAVFVPQRQRVKAMLTSGTGWLTAMSRLANPNCWSQVFRA